MGQIKLVTSTIIIALFTLAIISFAVNFGLDNGTSINLQDDPDFPSTKNNVNDEIDDFYLNINISSDAMAQSTIASQSEATEGGTAFKVSTRNSVSVATKVVKSSFQKIFGSDSQFSILYTAIISILGMMVLLYLYKSWRGNPD